MIHEIHQLKHYKETCAGDYMYKLAIIADDLTGALDPGIKFVQAGAKTQLFLNFSFTAPDIYEDTNVIAVGKSAGRFTVRDTVYSFAFCAR